MSVDPNAPHDPPGTSPEQRAEEDQGEDRPHRTRVQIVVVTITVVLIGVGIWLAHVISDARKLQDCLFSGRTNCAPVDVDSSGR